MSREESNDKAVKTGVFADVNKQIGYMKTDHVRNKIFKRRGQGETDFLYFWFLLLFQGGLDSDSDEDESTYKSTASRRSVVSRNDSDDEIDDISPYDSISNAGGLKVLFLFKFMKIYQKN